MVYKRCDCKGPCEHWTIDVRYQGQRTKGPAAKFGHLLVGHQKLPRTQKEAEVFEAQVKAWVVKGKPLPPPPTDAVTGDSLIAGWLKARETHAKARGKEPSEVNKSVIGIARKHFGAATAAQLEDPAIYRAFVLDYLERGRKICTPNRLLETVMRPAIRWALAQRPALLSHNPFGPYQFQIDNQAETKRNRRCESAEEAELLDACAILDMGETHHAGSYLADFITLAIDLGARKGEILSAVNRQVNYTNATITFPKTKRGEERVVPFNPQGRVAAILERRRFAGPKAAIIATQDGDAMANVQRAWVHVVCLANGIRFEQTGNSGRPTKKTMEAYKAIDLHIHDLRHEALTWWGECGLSLEVGEWLAGHATQTMHGRYRHESERKAKAELAQFVWPKEGLRAVSVRKNAVMA